MLRARIIDAMVFVVRERGYAGASVTSVSARAEVSRRTFYEAFDGLDDCFLAVLDEGYRRVRALMSGAFDREQSWLDGVRGALAALLSFFDSEPVLSHVLLVEAAAAGPWARERREQHIALLTRLIEERWGAPEDGHAHSLVNPGVMASLLGVLHSHLVAARPEPLIGLLGPLMGLVTSPYLPQRAVAREIALANAVARELLATPDNSPIQRSEVNGVEIPGLLRNPRAHRARACLLYVAEHPGASNREVATAIGISRHTHISTLLARLAAIGLLHKQPGPPGHPNSWMLTQSGVKAARALKDLHDMSLRSRDGLASPLQSTDAG